MIDFISRLSWADVPEFWRGVIWAVVVIFLLELANVIVQYGRLRWQRSHLPTHPIRSWWERNVTDSFWRATNQPTAGQRRAEIRAKYGPKRKAALQARVRHTMARFYAEYPSEAPKASTARSAPFPHFGVPELLTYREEEYVEPLRCSPGRACKNRELVQGQMFWAVPQPEDPDGKFVVVCPECVVFDAGVPSYGA